MAKPITTFLINDKEDSNGFHMDWAAIKAGAKDWIGCPGVLSCDRTKCDHTSGRSLQEAQRLSEEHKVTEIIDVKLDESTHTAYAVQNVTSSKFAGQVCSGDIEDVSQSVWLGAAPPDPNRIHVKAGDKYTPVHIAFLKNIDPAFGAESKVTEKGGACNVFMAFSASKSMGETEKPEEKQAMSMEDMTKEIHSMLKEVHSTAMKKSSEKPKEEVKSSAKPNYKFNWPEGQAEKPQYLDDLVH